MRTILITGSSRGIGLALAREASQRGFRVVLHGKTESKELEKALKTIPSSMKVVFDMADAAVMRREINKLIQKVGNLDLLLNNAGMLVWKPLKKHSDDEVKSVFAVNLIGPVLLTKHCLPYLKEGIINIASAASKEEYHGLRVKNETTYAASKFGLRGFSYVLAKEEKRLKILCVNPGGIATAMNDWGGASPQNLAKEVFSGYESMPKEANYKELNIFW